MLIDCARQRLELHLDRIIVLQRIIVDDTNTVEVVGEAIDEAVELHRFAQYTVDTINMMKQCVAPLVRLT